MGRCVPRSCRPVRCLPCRLECKFRSTLGEAAEKPGYARRAFFIVPRRGLAKHNFLLEICSALPRAVALRLSSPCSCLLRKQLRLLRTNKKRPEAFCCLCPGEDLNLQSLAGTTTSRWRVCQFHHLGIILSIPSEVAVKTSLLYATSSQFSISCAKDTELFLSDTFFATTSANLLLRT